MNCKFNNQLALFNLNDNRVADIKPYLFQPPAFNGQLWSWVGFCALWH